ncbi:MAG: hypothetical protein HY695_32220 [Deltaproteobacteria bacterium]|nr:hypothetical protein [Deltaproteobacteria bacterium]
MIGKRSRLWKRRGILAGFAFHPAGSPTTTDAKVVELAGGKGRKSGLQPRILLPPLAVATTLFALERFSVDIVRGAVLSAAHAENPALAAASFCLSGTQSGELMPNNFQFVIESSHHGL